MNRIDERFSRLKKEGKKGLIIYIGAGDPDLESTRRLGLAFDKAGVDVLDGDTGRLFAAGDLDGLVDSLRWFGDHRERLPEMKRAI